MSTHLRHAISAMKFAQETKLVPTLLELATSPQPITFAIDHLAESLATSLREQSSQFSIAQNLLREFSLSTEEGISLMCLAEALLRIPDAATRDALIADKIVKGDWSSHIGNSSSIFVNAAAHGMSLSAKMLDSCLNRLTAPVIRAGVSVAVKMMGSQFVIAETIKDAVTVANKTSSSGFLHSFDMLGEAAMTAEDAVAYLKSYTDAINVIGSNSSSGNPYNCAGISIKLSALHPRYSRLKKDRALTELYPRLLGLAKLARHYNIGMNIDAEESDRLELSLDLLEKLATDEDLCNWDGLGFVVQAYSKRCPAVINFIIALAKRTNRRIMVRLVKGAYWDSEIKRAQVDGLSGYPVYTRKEYTDVAYLACAKKLLAAPKEIYPQFATHNAHTVAAIYYFANPETYYPGQYEFQCLHGMGESLYQLVINDLKRPCRVYAPVGPHTTLLAYLVRRLLENGANTSFVNMIADSNISIAQLVEDPVAKVRAMSIVGEPHNKIALPIAMFDNRFNSAGLDLSDEIQLVNLNKSISNLSTARWHAISTTTKNNNPISQVLSPSNGSVVGVFQDCNNQQLQAIVENARHAAKAWYNVTSDVRAAALLTAADAIERTQYTFISLLMREAGKTANNAIAEIREAIDFLRYYAKQASSLTFQHRPLGVVLCISPWNFPLAIFLGQVSAALAAGNVVIAKPAEQTPLIAYEAVRILWAVGIPKGVLQLAMGPGETIGDALVKDAQINGVVFTGSTTVANIIYSNLAQRAAEQNIHPIPLIAETGGQNAMIVDSSALLEQVTNDVISSAFDSAGQRCSALRVLCVQEDIADKLIEMIKGAMRELQLGNPEDLSTDIGPVIDTEAQRNIENYIDKMRDNGFNVYAADTAPSNGTFVAPTLIEINSIDDLGEEVFGPVLHIVRYQSNDMHSLVKQINATGYGLTFGLHTRIQSTVDAVTKEISAGNVYVNRNIVGAVVGVQPFGGEGLSGTGPKAGGPLYLFRLLKSFPSYAPIRAIKSNGTTHAAHINSCLSILQQWAEKNGRFTLAAACKEYSIMTPTATSRKLPGPTGESNIYFVEARDNILCLGNNEDLLFQIAAVLAVGGKISLPAGSDIGFLPAEVKEHITLVYNCSMMQCGAVLIGSNNYVPSLLNKMTVMGNSIPNIVIHGSDYSSMPLHRLVKEKTITINTTAAGGNASLMML